MAQKYSSGEISHELLGSNTKQERNYKTITLSTCLYFFLKTLKIALNFINKISCSKPYFHLPVVSRGQRT